jgi:uncharacterized glyoxalase superfamily protein PhnB
MSQNSASGLPTFYPYFGYTDVAAAIQFLIEAFGFEKSTEIPGENATIIHAEMSFGNGALMLGTSTNDRPTPTEHGIYVFVEDVDAHYARAKTAGATIVYPPESTEWGTRRYRCLDIEGYEWSFGNYRPLGDS